MYWVVWQTNQLTWSEEVKIWSEPAVNVGLGKARDVNTFCQVYQMNVGSSDFTEALLHWSFACLIEPLLRVLVMKRLLFNMTAGSLDSIIRHEHWVCLRCHCHKMWRPNHDLVWPIHHWYLHLFTSITSEARPRLLYIVPQAPTLQAAQLTFEPLIQPTSSVRTPNNSFNHVQGPVSSDPLRCLRERSQRSRCTHVRRYGKGGMWKS